MKNEVWQKREVIEFQITYDSFGCSAIMIDF